MDIVFVIECTLIVISSILLIYSLSNYCNLVIKGNNFKNRIETLTFLSADRIELEDKVNNFLKIAKNLKGFKLLSSNIAINSNKFYYQLTYEYEDLTDGKNKNIMQE